MVKALFSIYNRFLGSHFFNKLMLAYISILIAVLLFLTYFISMNTSVVVRENQLKENRQVLTELKNYLDNNESIIRDIIFRLYNKDNQPFLQSLLSLLDTDSSAIFENDPFWRKEIVSQLNKMTAYSGIDIQDIVLTGGKSNNTYKYVKDAGVFNNDLEFADNALNIENYQGIQPSILAGYRINNEAVKVYGIVSKVIDPTTSETKGKMIFHMDVKSLDRLLSTYKESVKGSFLILTPSGDVIYDSANTYYYSRYPYLSQIREAVKEGILEEDSYIETLYSDKNGIIFVSIIPKTKINKDIEILKNAAYVLAVLSIISIFILYNVGIGIFSRKIQVITKGIKAIGNSNLSYRIPVSQKHDEIEQIAIDFNTMCDKLQNYINKAYIYELKQKNAEMQKLQAQINPHFLYNTLEAIRSRVVRDGNDEAGEMIHSLAAIFRMSIKGDPVVEISEEIEYCKMYLNIFDVRYEDYFKKIFEIDTAILHYGILKNILQPVIENYILHGFNPAKSDNCILIKAYQLKEDIIISVKDNGSGISGDDLAALNHRLESNEMSENNSIGLSNVNERIRIVFGHPYGISVKSMGGKGTEITIRIPVKTKDEIMSMVLQPK